MKPTIKVKTVIDAGPIIHLVQINAIKILQYIPSLLIPRSVIKEIGKDKTIIKNWGNLKIIPTRKTSENIFNAIAQLNLQPPDIDVLSIAYQEKAIILTDDLKLRKIAQKLSIDVHGSVGIIAWAYREKIISIQEGETALNHLYSRSNLFITHAIIEETIQHLREYNKPS